MPLSSTDHYTIISADCHAGASHETYRQYLEARYLDDFDAWRGKYRNPFSDLRGNRRTRNWDDDLRNSQLEADGIVGEVVFPNTVPPFFPSFVLFARRRSPTSTSIVSPVSVPTTGGSPSGVRGSPNAAPASGRSS